MENDDFADELRGDHNGRDPSELGSMCDGKFIPHDNTHHLRTITVGALAAVAVAAGIIIFKSHHQAGQNI